MNLPLSKIQEQFWVLGSLYPNTPAYNIPLIYKLSGKLCINTFKEALIKVLKKHSMLSASIHVHDNTPSFNVPANLDITNYFDILHLKENLSNEAFNEYILTHAHKSFKLDGGFLTRVRYVSFDDSAFIVFVFHHIIIDHHSKSIFLNDISQKYSSLLNNSNNTALHQVTEYKSFVQHEKKWLSSAEANKMREDWKSEFKNSILPVDLPFDKNKDVTFKSQGKRLHFSLYNELSNQIDKFSSENNIDPFVFLLTAYAVFLARIGKQTTFAIGVPLSNRRNEDYKKTIGCFVNVLPLIIKLDNQTTFSEIRKQIRCQLLKNHRRQEISYIELQSIYNENQKGYPFQVGFTFEEPVDFSLEKLDIKPEVIERNGSQLEIFLTLWRSNTGYQGFWEFNTDKFNDKTIHRFIEVFKTIIGEVLHSPNKKYLEYNVLPKPDINLIEAFNNTQCPYHDDLCIHQVFEKQVAEIPNNTALIFNDTKISYQELNTHANRLANYLIDNNTQVGDIIAVACERRIEMMVSILAILKSGATYLPIEINNPPQVSQEIINNANPRFICASSLGSNNLLDKSKIISIENILQNPYSSNNFNPNTKVTSQKPAYVIYTSGSTGIPKGVVVKHHSVINRIEWMQKAYPLTEKDVLMQKTPITFDVSVWELFWWFFNKAKLTLLEHLGEKNPILIIESIRKHGVTKIHFVPSMFVFFIDALRKKNLTDSISTLTNIFCSGESLPASMVKAFNLLDSSFPLAKVVNLYGPTEATVDVSYYNCPEYLNESDKIFIGRPIDNTELYVVNDKLKVQPVGVKGELLITGTNLAVGYLNNEPLTQNHFVKFRKLNGDKVIGYKTGDIVTLHNNGEIEYLGRKDNQVKIRGIRIELGEIEAKLTQHPKISTAAVSLINEQENKTIISYVVLQEPNSISERKLLNDFKKILSPIMVPSQIIFMDKLPLVASGKLNRALLPKPRKQVGDFNIQVKSHTYHESKLFQLWNSLLPAENIGITDNFYDIGGNSLLAIKLSMLIANIFSIEPDVISIMEYPTIKDYASYLENKKLKYDPDATIDSGKAPDRNERTRRRFSHKR